jgi:hypothetical protein
MLPEEDPFKLLVALIEFFIRMDFRFLQREYGKITL